MTGLSRYMVYEWRKEDSAFKEAWDNAIAFANGSLESAAYLKLAQELTSIKPLTMPAARLTETMLAGAFPDKYKRQGTSVSVDNRQMSVTIDWASLPEEIVTKFNQNLITLQDVYEYIALQSQQSERSTASDD